MHSFSFSFFNFYYSPIFILIMYDRFDEIETRERRSASKGQKKPILSLHQVCGGQQENGGTAALFSHEYNHPLVSLIYKQQPKRKHNN